MAFCCSVTIKNLMFVQLWLSSSYGTEQGCRKHLKASPAKGHGHEVDRFMLTFVADINSSFWIKILTHFYGIKIFPWLPTMYVCVYRISCMYVPINKCLMYIGTFMVQVSIYLYLFTVYMIRHSKNTIYYVQMYIQLHINMDILSFMHNYKYSDIQIWNTYPIRFILRMHKAACSQFFTNYSIVFQWINSL